MDSLSDHSYPLAVPLGRCLITSNALARLNLKDVIDAMRRHAAGDWGELCEEDRLLNDQARANGDRLLSSYRDSEGARFWIITEWDRSSTTILLPEDY